MRIFILILAISIVVPAFGQRNKKKEDEEEVVPQYVEGIIYALPRTGIRVYVKATRTDFTPGPYSKFAEQLLGITSAGTESTASWVIDKIEMEPFSEPDPTQVFKALGESAALVGLTPDGCIASVNGGIMKIPPPKRTVTNPVSYSNEATEYQFTNLSDLPFFSPGDSTNRFRPTRLTLEQKAAQAASRILDCRKMKFELANGYLDVLPPDGKGYEASMKQLDKIEKQYTALFTGRSKSKDYKFSFEFVPSTNETKGEVIFRFSEQKGVLDKSDLTGKPVMLEVSKVSDLTGSYDRLKKSDNPNAGESGIYYRQPGMANVRLIYDLKSIATAKIPIAQFGAVAPVPEIYLDGNYTLEYHPETGEIKNIILIK